MISLLVFIVFFALGSYWYMNKTDSYVEGFLISRRVNYSNHSKSEMVSALREIRDLTGGWQFMKLMALANQHTIDVMTIHWKLSRMGKSATDPNLDNYLRMALFSPPHITMLYYRNDPGMIRECLNIVKLRHDPRVIKTLEPVLSIILKNKVNLKTRVGFETDSVV